MTLLSFHFFLTQIHLFSQTCLICIRLLRLSLHVCVGVTAEVTQRVWFADLTMSVITPFQEIIERNPAPLLWSTNSLEISLTVFAPQPNAHTIDESAVIQK